MERLALVVGGGVTLTVLLLAVAALSLTRGATVAVAAPARNLPPGKLVTTLSQLARPGDEAERDTLRAQLTQAGFSGKRVLELYLAARAAFALGAPLLAWMLVRGQQPPMVAAAVTVAAGSGYYLPFALVSMRRSERQRRLRQAFPNALDMLVTCLEAGLGIDVALRYVAKELASAAPELCRELSLVNAELAAGVTRADALRHLHQRTDLDEIGAMVQELAQAEKYGSRIAQALRAHAKHARVQRLLEGEKKAAEAAPKLTVFMILFLLPPLFIVLLGPTFVNVVEHVLPGLRHR